MTKTITTTIEKSNLIEVKVCWSTNEANELLETKKWILLTGGISHRDSGGFQAKPCFILARTKC